MKKIFCKVSIVIIMGCICFSGLSGHKKTGSMQISASTPSNKVKEYKDKRELQKTRKQKAQSNELVSVAMQDSTQTMDMDTYLVGVVAGEMPASFDMEALKAQAIASRTYVYKRGLMVDNTTKTQVYLTDTQMQKNWQGEYQSKRDKINQAVKATHGQVMKYQGEYISALFFSSSNGYTENCNEYFDGGVVPYLKSVSSPWDISTDPKCKREKRFTLAQLKSIFHQQNITFGDISYTKSGRIHQVKVNNTVYSGRQIREMLSLPASCFSIDRKGDTFIFSSVGSGHGVGMSQYGAQGMALAGHDYQSILHHYYTDIEIINNQV